MHCGDGSVTLRRVEGGCRSWRRSNENTEAVTRLIVSCLQETECPAAAPTERAREFPCSQPLRSLSAPTPKRCAISFRAAFPLFDATRNRPHLTEPWLLIQNSGTLSSRLSRGRVPCSRRAWLQTLNKARKPESQDSVSLIWRRSNISVARMYEHACVCHES